ncbi:MAG: hypothetical protein JWM73_578 [Solirubrobacterales bacterium]|nr:hypothetical protein [Solirubrobacterales bacterium]
MRAETAATIPRVLRAIAISVLLLGLVPGVARGAWLRPVPGPVVRAFSFSPAERFAARRHRGIVLAARPGAPVRAACPGVVAFAGSVGRAGPTISVRCGPLRATYQGLAEIDIEEGQTVGAGATIAHVGRAGGLRLGARRGPAAYVDPATLFADRRLPLGPAPRTPRAPRWPSPDPPPSPPLRPASPRPARTPLLAWLGLGLLAGATPVGALARRRSRRRRSVRGAAATRAA